MDPEYELAQAAGMIPQDQLANPYGSDVPSDSAPPTSESSSFTLEDILGHVLPGYTPPASQPVDSDVFNTPSPANPPSAGPWTQANPDAPALTPGEMAPGTSQGQSASGRGFSQGKYNQIKKGPAGDLQRRNQDIQADQDNTTKQILGNFAQAARTEEDAVKRTVEAQNQYNIEQADQDEWLAGKQREYDTKIQAAHLSAQTENQANRQRYLTSLQDFASQQVNPGRLWQNMGTGGQVGVLAATFVHDFLSATKGIKTTAMDTLNNAINRDIDAQVANIKHKGDVAAGFKNLWDMTRQDSTSEMESLVKMRGYYLEDMKLQVQAHMGRFQSKLNVEKGNMAIAKIHQEQAKNIFEVAKYSDEATRTRLQQSLSQYATELQNAQTAWSNSISARRLKMDEDEAKAKKKGDAMAGLIPDVSPSGKGAMAFQFRSDVSQAKRDETLGKIEGTSNMIRDTEEYREMMRQYNSLPPGPARDHFSSTNQKKMEALNLSILSNEILRKSGKAANESEVARIQKTIPQNVWGHSGNMEAVVAGFEKRGIDDMRTNIRTVAYDLPADDPRRQVTGGGDSFAGKEYTDAQATHADKGAVATVTDIAEKAITKPDRFRGNVKGADNALDDALSGVIKGATPNAEWSKYWKEHPEDAQKAQAAGRGAKQRVDADMTRPGFAAGLYALRMAAQEGNDRARRVLADWAGVSGGTGDGDAVATGVLPDGTDANSPQGRAIQNFAIWEYSQLKPHLGKVTPTPSPSAPPSAPQPPVPAARGDEDYGQGYTHGYSDPALRRK